MILPDLETEAAGVIRRLFAFTGGMLFPGRIRRILTLAGLPPHLGRPGKDDLVAVWGRSPRAARGEAVAAATGATIVRIEDAFLRSIRPGRAGDAAIGLLIDRTGVHFDASAPSDLETLLATHPLDDHGLLSRARDGMARLRVLHLSKYNAHDPTLAAPAPGYVLIVDQVREDASLIHGGTTAQTFDEMLVAAQRENPGQRVVIKAHPETTMGLRPGHYGPETAAGIVTLLTAPVSPYTLLNGAIAVYTATSQLGFEAILAGHRPRVFGQPFYAGWGLSDDEVTFPRRHRKLTKEQLFAAAMLLAPTWYDPCRDRLCSFEEAVDQLEAEVRAFREDRRGHVAIGMRLWKRRTIQRVFGREKPVVFTNNPVRAAKIAIRTNRDVMVWAARTPVEFPLPLRKVEDGFLRSRGLGAALVPPLSLIADDLGIHYDPTAESRLDRLIAAGPPPGGADRAARLVARIVGAGLSKYNLGGAQHHLPSGPRIVVPGQVEDDASILKGAGDIRTNVALLQAVRLANPDATILYKPHPDVEAGLRLGAVPQDVVLRYANLIVTDTDPVALLTAETEVWTMTSLLGFEALLRGLHVTCLGLPFYAGWGLTRDLVAPPHWRNTTPSLHDLAHAALIAYPRYVDPVSGRPCPAEVIVDRLTSDTPVRRTPVNGMLAKAQGLFASRAALWRKWP